MDKRTKRLINIFPWFYGCTADLLFYIAISTLFLTVVKELSSAQIVSLTTVATVGCIIFRFPILSLIQKIGNTASIRIGGVCLLASSILITFASNYWFVVAGRMLFYIATIFHSAAVVALENCLDAADCKEEFVKARAKGNTIYAALTMIIAFIASPLFNINHYLPMFGCIVATTIGCVLSFLIKDYTPFNKIPRKEKTKTKFHYNKLVLLAIIVYGIFYPVVTCGQSEGQLFIQEQLLAELTVEKTALIIGAILCVSRVIRLISNMVFMKIYMRFRSTIGVILTASLATSIALLLFGSFLPFLALRITVMSLGFVIILFIRDPYKLYAQDVLFDNTPKEQHQSLLAVMAFAVNVGNAGTSAIFATILLKNPMWVVMAIALSIAIVEIILSIWLYKVILDAKNNR